MPTLRRLFLHLLWLGWMGVSASAPADTGTTQARWVGLSDTLFRHLSGSDAAAGNTFAQDGSGFMWVGSQAGLLRWDGYHFRRYTADPQTPRSLPDSYIYKLHTDRRGRLWVGTNSGGLARYEPDTDSFVLHAMGTPGPRNVNVSAIADDGQGGLWIGTRGGLEHMDAADRVQRDPDGTARTRLSPGAASAAAARAASQATPSPGEAAVPPGLPEGGVSALLNDRQGTLWVGTLHGLLRREPGARHFSAVLLPTRGGLAPAIDVVYQDTTGRIWVGTRAHGAFIVDADSASSRQVTESSSAGGLSTDRITAVVEVAPDEIWLGTEVGGIVVAHGQGHAQRRLRHRADTSTSLKDDDIQALYRDRSGLVWVATNNAVSLHDPQQRTIVTLLGGAGRADGISGAQVPSVISTRSGQVWAAVSGGGVDMLDPMLGRIGQLRPNPARPVSALPKGRVMAMAEGPDGEVYLGTQLGLYRSDAQGHALVRMRVPQRADTAAVRALCYHNGLLWIGGLDGLWGLDLHNASKPALVRHEDSVTLGDSRVSSIGRGRGEDLWVGTQTGLVHLDTPTSPALRVPSDPGDPTRLPGTYVSSTLIDRQDRLWVSSFGVGVQVLERQDATGRLWFRRLGLREGLPHAGVDMLLEDARGSVWASTDKGLAVIDAKTLEVRTLQRPQGVSILAYWTNSGTVTDAGELIFGGQGGISVVRPADVGRWTYEPPLVVTNARAGTTALSAGALTRQQDGTAAPIEISSQDRGLWVEFSALDYSAPEQNRYAYRLQGFDTDWIPTEPTRRFASYTNLPPGSYTLQIRGSNRDGAWARTPLQIPIRVMPAWYQTYWFRALAMLLALGLVGALVQTRTIYLRRRQRELQGLVEERTAELEQRSEELRESQRQLEHLAYVDPLTGLPNRRVFNDELRYQTALAARGGPPFALLLLDLDGFKQINDSLGHDAGDALLKHTAERLLQAVREADRVTRTGGDEFAVLLPQTTDRAAVDTICRRIVASVGEPGSYNGASMRVGVSIGVALCPQHGSTPDPLYKAADTALYAAKHAGRNTWRWYAPAEAAQKALTSDRAAEP